MAKYEVLVGNIGSVINTDSLKDAQDAYVEYVEQSKSETGRAGGEDVHFLEDGEPIKDFMGSLNSTDDMSDADEEGNYGKGGAIISTDRAKEIASHWHGGQNSALYQFLSSGKYLLENHLRYLQEVQQDIDYPEQALYPYTLAKKDERELNSLKIFFEYKGEENGIKTEWGKHSDYGYPIPYVSKDTPDEIANKIKTLKYLAEKGGSMEAGDEIIRGKSMTFDEFKDKLNPLNDGSTYFYYNKTNKVGGQPKWIPVRIAHISDEEVELWDNENSKLYAIKDFQFNNYADPFIKLSSGGSMAKGGEITKKPTGAKWNKFKKDFIGSAMDNGSLGKKEAEQLFEDFIHLMVQKFERGEDGYDAWYAYSYKYAVEYRDMHSAVHNLVATKYPDKEKAEEVLSVIEAIEDSPAEGDMEMNYDILNRIGDTEDALEINFRHIKEINGKKYWGDDDEIMIINTGVIPDMYEKGGDVKKKQLKKGDSVQIIGRRWFERTNGNTYHSTDVYVNNEFAGREHFSYGYGDQYVQTGMEILKEHYNLPAKFKDEKYISQYALKEYGINILTSVSDVSRKKDLEKGGSIKSSDNNINWLITGELL
jgi:hypothetical protein